MGAQAEIGLKMETQADEAGEMLAFRDGGEEAFEALFRRHQRPVYGWILRIVRDAGAAEDLTIETFFRIHRARERFDPARGFEPWARRIATHAALDWLRRQRPENMAPAEWLNVVPARNAGDPAMSAEVRLKVAQAVLRLPANLRAAALLSLIEEQPHREIAAALGISVAAVKLRVFRAMRRLRSDLERQGMKP
ncbi:MAG TPA: sigma-70 family RNA polymerase sigma factor [Terracidiphilus sp.]|nr:sigma-70 family RNA polymerase sigma factor [Terracidiphilus sp.]